MSPDPDDIDRLAKMMRALAAAHRQSLAASEALMKCQSQRAGARGGKRTSLNAKWTRAAEQRDRMMAECRALSNVLFGEKHSLDMVADALFSAELALEPDADDKERSEAMRLVGATIDALGRRPRPAP